MSMVYILSTTVWIFVTLLDFIYSVNADLCPSGIECDYNEYCCEDGCCSSESNYGYAYGYGFYNLWYFWFVIIMVMMTCCGACSYVKKRQYYMRQQEGLARSAHLTGSHVHHPPTTYGVHPSNLATPVGTFPGPPAGTFPGPPAYNEVTGKPDQFPKAEFGYPNYGFAAPPYSPHEASMPPQSAAPAPEGTIPVHTTTADGTIPVQYPPSAAMAYPPPNVGVPTATPDSVPTTAPPPYTPSVTSPSVLPTDQTNPVA